MITTPAYLTAVQDERLRVAARERLAHRARLAPAYPTASEPADTWDVVLAGFSRVATPR